MLAQISQNIRSIWKSFFRTLRSLKLDDVILGFFQLTLTGEDIQEVLHFASEKLFTLRGEINQVLLKILQIFGISIQYITHKPMNFCSFS